MGDRPLSARDMRQSVIVTVDGNTVMLPLRRQEHHLAAIAENCCRASPRAWLGPVGHGLLSLLGLSA